MPADLHSQLERINLPCPPFLSTFARGETLWRDYGGGGGFFHAGACRIWIPEQEGLLVTWEPGESYQRDLQSCLGRLRRWNWHNRDDHGRIRCSTYTLEKTSEEYCWSANEDEHRDIFPEVEWWCSETGRRELGAALSAVVQEEQRLRKRQRDLVASTAIEELHCRLKRRDEGFSANVFFAVCAGVGAELEEERLYLDVSFAQDTEWGSWVVKYHQFVTEVVYGPTEKTILLPFNSTVDSVTATFCSTCTAVRSSRVRSQPGPIAISDLWMPGGGALAEEEDIRLWRKGTDQQGLLTTNVLLTVLRLTGRYTQEQIEEHFVPSSSRNAVQLTSSSS